MAVITISRQGGAGGKTLGKIISKKLGYTFIDDEIIREVAKYVKVSPHWVKSVEKEAGGMLHKVIDKLLTKSYMDRLLGGLKGYIDENVYVDTLKKVITDLARRDNCVILGRGGQYILSDSENAYHLLLVADLVDRVKFMVDHYNFTPKQAKNVINTYDKRRVTLYKKFHKVGYNQPDYYHLVINTSKVSIEKAADIVCNLVGS